MNMKSNIRYGALLLLAAGGFFQACQQDVLDDAIYDKDTLIAQGRYLTARSVDAFALQNPSTEPQPFEVGTPYRLLAFTKRYEASNPMDETAATHPRFNKVAWEGETSGALRFINVDSEPDKWFGFSAINGETGGTDNLVSLDFYGFTYGEAEEHNDNYITLEGWNGAETQLENLKHSESVAGGRLRDLMRGVLFNQNISTAGVASTDADGYQKPNDHTQSVLPFRHCFSKLTFQVSQQGNEEETDAEGNPLPSFENLVVEDIVITGTYRNGVVSLADGKVNVSEKMNRQLMFDEDFDGKVPLNNTYAGEIVVFPSDGASLGNMPDGYAVGLSITVKSTERNDIANMLTNTGGSADSIEEVTDADGVTWFRGTIVKTEIIDYYTEVTNPDRVLYFKQNTSYMLIITFQKDAVRIITVIPQVEEWLPGEGTADNPWQEQALGQPQMFDNIVWSDRNIGADHFDPTGSDYEKCVGYFYQAGRNIPYYPFKYSKYKNAWPTAADKHAQDLANGNSAYNQTEYRFFPMVDHRILNMYASNDWTMSKSYTPQMSIPEQKPSNYFNFVKDGNNNNPTNGLSDSRNMYWDKGQSNQPVSGAWVIPSSQDFLTIFPSTPHAGNITFRVGGDNSNPMNWNLNAMSTSQRVLRVTVPYYVKDMSGPAKNNASAKYTDAWNTLDSNNDPGCTGTGYSSGPGSGSNPNYEPDGDPEDGFASVYIISREGDDEVVPDILKKTDLAGQNWVIKSWGTIYAIKRIYTSEAYRMRWRVLNASKTAKNPCFYVEICRYRCKPDAELTVSNYKSYDWDHPAATIYFPICGLGDWSGQYINFGTECQYATSDKIENGRTSSVQIKVSGNDGYNAYIAVVKKQVNRNFGIQIRPIMRDK